MDGIKRFTTEYMAEEDRLRLSLETNDGEVRLLWLTRRLVIRLVPQLVKLLSQNTALLGEQGAPRTDNAQRRSQMSALGQLEQQSPVRPDAEQGAVAEHLITRLSGRLARGAVLVDFKIGEDTLIQTVPFPEAALRQWLVVVEACFRKGEWAEEIWPDWISVKGGEDGPDPVRLN